MVVPAEEVGFKERVKNDIVLVEAVLEFKPTVVKSDKRFPLIGLWTGKPPGAKTNDDRCITWHGDECVENQRDGLPGEGFCLPHAYNHYNEMEYDHNLCTEHGFEWQ